MSSDGILFGSFLNTHDDAAWGEVLDQLQPMIHPVDQRATRIWFYFFPMKLARALQENSATTIERLHLAGNYRLQGQADSSAEFLYGHRYWNETIKAVAGLAASGKTPDSLALAEQIPAVARQVGSAIQVDASLLVGITAVAFMTLQQIGWAAFEQLSYQSAERSKWTMTPEQLLRERTRGNSRSLGSWLNPVKRQFTITFRENDREGRFQLINEQDLVTASTMDVRDFKPQDPRRIAGPLPSDCRSATCGTCWVGVLAGSERLCEPNSLEIRKMTAFGYPGFSPTRDSLIRLGCQAACTGNVSIAIPPWNGFPGKLDTE